MLDVGTGSHHSDVVSVTQMTAQREHQSRLTAPDRASNANLLADSHQPTWCG